MANQACSYLADLRQQIADIHRAMLAAISRGDVIEWQRLQREHATAWNRYQDACKAAR